jgi:predicted site-specific integrase-resolvase
MIPTICKTFSLNKTDLIVFVMEMEFVICEVGSGLYMQNRLMSLFKGLSKVEFNLIGEQNKDRSILNYSLLSKI